MSEISYERTLSASLVSHGPSSRITGHNSKVRWFRNFAMTWSLGSEIPENNGQTDVTNKTIFNYMKKKLDRAKGRWIEELPGVLWAYWTTKRRGTNETPFVLDFWHWVVIPTKATLFALCSQLVALKANEEQLRINLDLMEERRE